MPRQMIFDYLTFQPLKSTVVLNGSFYLDYPTSISQLGIPNKASHLEKPTQKCIIQLDDPFFNAFNVAESDHQPPDITTPKKEYTIIHGFISWTAPLSDRASLRGRAVDLNFNKHFRCALLVFMLSLIIGLPYNNNPAL